MRSASSQSSATFTSKALHPHWSVTHTSHMSPCDETYKLLEITVNTNQVIVALSQPAAWLYTKRSEDPFVTSHYVVCKHVMCGVSSKSVNASDHLALQPPQYLPRTRGQWEVKVSSELCREPYPGRSWHFQKRSWRRLTCSTEANSYNEVQDGTAPM